MPHGCSADEGEGEWRTEAAAAVAAAGSRVPCRVAVAKGKRGELECLRRHWSNLSECVCMSV